jgi:anti-sigma regulatory factor (Ser/Thr protein kinase)
MVYNLIIHRQEEVREGISKLLFQAEQECSLTEEREFCLRLVLNELINNAVSNHNRKEDLEVQIRMDINNIVRGCRILIMSNGRGFNAEAVMKHLDERPCDRMAESGRGLMLVKAYSQSIKFNKKGSKVLVKLS